jgi:hypothetical protein
MHSFGGRLLLAAALIWGTMAAASADSETESPSVVAVARAESIMTTEGILNPGWLYPEGRIDYEVIETLLSDAVASSVGVEEVSDAWEVLISPSDRIGIQIDEAGIQPHAPLLEALVRQIMDRGVPMRNIIIYAGEESALFQAGYDISGRTPGVRVMGTDSHGFRRGLSRIALNECTKILNISRLRVDERIGMYGALANCLAVVPYADRERMMRNPEQLPEAAAKATMKRKMALHVIDALSPGFRLRDGGGRYETWAYNGVLASPDPVALDEVGRQILEAKLAEEAEAGNTPGLEVNYLLPAAENYRLGVADPEEIAVVEIGP